MIVYISRCLFDRLRTETDTPMQSDFFYLSANSREHLISYVTETIYYDPRYVDDMKQGCVLAYYPQDYHSGEDKFRFCSKQGIPIYKWEGVYINYKESDFIKCFGLSHRLRKGSPIVEPKRFPVESENDSQDSRGMNVFPNMEGFEET